MINRVERSGAAEVAEGTEPPRLVMSSSTAPTAQVSHASARPPRKQRMVADRLAACVAERSAPMVFPGGAATSAQSSPEAVKPSMPSKIATSSADSASCANR